MTQCAKIIVGFMANVGNVSVKRLPTLFFFNFYLNVYYVCELYWHKINQ